MHNIIWRNRANAVLGLVIALVALFSGFPDYIDTIILVVIGGLIFLFGFTGNRYVRALYASSPSRTAYRAEESFAESGPAPKAEEVSSEFEETPGENLGG